MKKLISVLCVIAVLPPFLLFRYRRMMTYHPNNIIDICLKRCYHLFRHKSEKRCTDAKKTALQMD